MDLIQEPFERGILIVDDDADFLEALEGLIKKSGYKNVYTASSGLKALSLLTNKSNSIYLVLSDMMMPEMTGIEFIQHISNVLIEPVGFVMITAYASIETKQEFFNLSSDSVMALEYLEKPFGSDVLFKEIETSLESIHVKRMGQIRMSAESIHNRLNHIETKLGKFESLDSMHELLRQIDRKQMGFLSSLGIELLKALLIAASLIAILALGVGDFVKRIIGL